MNFNRNKKFYLLSLAVVLISLFFFAGVSPVSAASCEKSQNRFSFVSFLNPLASLVEKVVKDFGYKISLAAAPDPDFCGSDSVGCSGASSYATISWEPAPDIQFYPYSYYLLTISGVGTYNTGWATNYTVYGLANNTTYNWSLNDTCLAGVPCYAFWRNAFPGSQIPYGSFTTPNCVPPPTVTLTTWSVFTIPDPVSLYWSSTNANSCTASGDWSGDKAVQGEEHFSKPRGNYTFTLTCTGPGGNASDTENVRVIQVPQCSFTANPTSIILPASSTLSWSCEYADSCSIDQGIGSVNPVSGSKSVRPSQTTTYTLTCSGLDGSRSSQATVNIGFEPTRREVIPR